MSLLEQITPSPRRVMTLFYLIDTSGSMMGTKIGTVNSAMEECLHCKHKESKLSKSNEYKE